MSTIVNSPPPNDIQWGFHKPSNNKDSQIIHYYDTWAQEIWPSGASLNTKVTQVQNGNWNECEFTPPECISITQGEYTKLRSDHPTNGVLYMVAVKGGKLEFLRYQYMMDLSYILDDWSQQFKNDNSISDLNIQIQNVGIEAFMGESSLFLPGSKIDMSMMFDKYELPMGVYWLDDISFNQSNETVSLSSRNYSGHWLNDQTLDELGLSPVQGSMIDVVKALFEHAGITDYLIQPALTVWTKYEFKPEDTILNALKMVCDSARNPNPELELCLLEHHSGRLLFGYRNWLDQYMPNSYYTFHEGQDLFARTTEKCLDGSFTRLMITGEVKKADENSQTENHTPIFVDVKNFPHWTLKRHKTKHVKTPTPMTRAEFEAFANAQAEAFQYVGINEDFTGPYRPQLYVGDIAEVKHADGIHGTSLGVINQVIHNFSKVEGFTTEFVVDSGGVATEGDSYVIYSTTSKDNGRNRRMNMVDVIKALKL